MLTCCSVEQIKMGFAWIRVVFVVCIATAITASITDLLNENKPRVRIYRKNTLLPFGCIDGVIDASERGLYYMSATGVCRVTPLTAINLNHNELQAFPQGVLEATTINITDNLLSSLPSLSQLNPRIRHLDLSENEISNPADNGLRPLGSLETLIVSNNQQLRSLRFLPLPCGLRYLEAVNINLQNIEGPLTQCILLETLILSKNSLTTFPEDAFSGLAHLRVLDLGQNSIESVSSQLFNALIQLRSLSLYHNKLRTLPSNLFSSLSNLENLDLTGNLFTSLPSGLFSPLSRLTHLNLTGLPLTAFPTEVSNLPVLKELQLTFNRITSLPETSFSALPHLEELFLIYNNITSIPSKIFSGLSNLKAVGLANNPLTTLPSNVFSGASNLNFVWLPCIGLTSENLRLVRNVTSLFYGECGSFDLNSGVLSVLSRAENLLIGLNNITSVAEGALQGLPLLKLLDLSDNSITSLPAGVFSQLSNVNKINLKGNRLATIPERLFSGLLNLKSIILARNLFTAVPEKLFHGLRALESVDLSTNQLTSVPPQLFAGLPSLKEVNLKMTLLPGLPAYSPVWASIPALAFGVSDSLRVDAASLRPWLAEGARYLALEGAPEEAVAPAAVAWLLEEPHVQLATGSPSGCHCGFARKGRVLLHLCVAMRCERRPRHLDEWLLAAVRQANASAIPTATPTIPTATPNANVALRGA